MPYDDLIRQIDLEPINLRFGSVSKSVLIALAGHVGDQPVRQSIETGCGKTTLLLSHLSRHHQVFSLDATALSGHRLLSPTVALHDGPTQRTLPGYQFPAPLDLAFLDGPHAYPFPDLEYFFIYPHLAPGALLALDDVHIPTLSHLYEFLKEEAMFQLLERVDNTAFFRRTKAPTFNPFGDNWEEQNYNKRKFPIGFLPRCKHLYARLPEPWKRRLRPVLSSLKLR